MTHDKELIERLALEVAKNISFEHRAPLSDTSIITFATRLLAAYLAERGKEAVAWRVVRKIDDKPLLDWIDGNGCDAVSIFEHGYIQRAFLAPSPAIPEGMALVPIEPTEVMIEAGRNSYDPQNPILDCWRAMIAAAGVKP